MLPKLLYVGDVPVQPTVYGAALLYRLLKNYPNDKLAIVEGSAWRSDPRNRLAGVPYYELNLGPTRLIHSRLHAVYGSWLISRSRSTVRQLAAIARRFQPDAVLTVAQSYSWLTAAYFAEQSQIPMHLIIHDEWPRRADMLAAVYRRAQSMFAQYYVRAASRFCISDPMARHYEERFGVPATVLPPIQSISGPSVPPDSVSLTPREFTVAYAGTINTMGYSRALAAVAEAAAKVGGKLKIFGPVDFRMADVQNLKRSNVQFCGFVPAEELIDRLRKEADLLFLPMSFEQADRENMTISFPSKLADYTAVGLPILIYGPPYCSIVRWAEQRPDVAEIVSTEDGAELARVVKRLTSDPNRRCELAQGALQIGREQFSSDRVRQIFYQEISDG